MIILRMWYCRVPSTIPAAQWERLLRNGLRNRLAEQMICGCPAHGWQRIRAVLS